MAPHLCFGYNFLVLVMASIGLCGLFGWLVECTKVVWCYQMVVVVEYIWEEYEGGLVKGFSDKFLGMLYIFKAFLGMIL